MPARGLSVHVNKVFHVTCRSSTQVQVLCALEQPRASHTCVGHRRMAFIAAIMHGAGRDRKATTLIESCA